MRITASKERRNTVLDIETVTLSENDEKGALSPISGRVACVSLLVDNGDLIEEVSIVDRDERKILKEFWELVRSTDLLIGWNVMDFDLMFLRNRSIIQGVRPSMKLDLRRYYSRQVLDLMTLFSNYGANKHVGLGKIGEALGVGGKSGHGTDVAKWWSEGDLSSIARYCQEDVRLTFRVFCRMTFQLLPSRFAGSQPLVEFGGQTQTAEHVSPVKQESPACQSAVLS